MKKTYAKHMFSTLTEYLSEIKSGTCNAERITIFKSFRTVIEDITDNGTTNFPIFCEKLQECGMTCKDISKLMNLVINLLNLNEVHHRLINKSNKSEKNMIFTWICIQNSSQLIELIEEFYLKEGIKPKYNNINIKIKEEMIKLVDEVNSQKQTKISGKEENTIPMEVIDTIPNEPSFINECPYFDPTFGSNGYEDDIFDEDALNLEFFL